jgi:hypothetical protein
LCSRHRSDRDILGCAHGSNRHVLCGPDGSEGGIFRSGHVCQDVNPGRADHVIRRVLHDSGGVFQDQLVGNVLIQPQSALPPGVQLDGVRVLVAVDQRAFPPGVRAGGRAGEVHVHEAAHKGIAGGIEELLLGVCCRDSGHCFVLLKKQKAALGGCVSKMGG